MKHIVHPKTHLSISVVIMAAASFAGFEALAFMLQKFQLLVFWQTAAYLYIFLMAWTVFIYDTHRRHIAAAPVVWSQLSNYLILPSVIYWSAVVLMFLSPFHSALLQIWTVVATVGLAAGLWYLKVAFHDHREASHKARQMIFGAKILGSYLGFAAALGIGRYYEFGALWTGLCILLVAELLLRQALFQHHEMSHAMLHFVLWIGLGLGVIGFFLYYFWNVNFYSAGLTLAAVYNTAWGYLQHKYIDHDFSKKIFYEYLAVLFVVLVILLSTTNFSEKI